MIRDRQVLDDSEAPDKELMLHRSEETQRMRDLLRDARRDETNCLLYVAGPPGVGKTMITRAVARQQSDAIWEKAYVECWGKSSNDILYSVAQQTTSPTIHRQSTPVGAVTDALMADPDTQRLVILDEADQLEDTSCLFTLATMPRTALILVGNHMTDLYEGMDDRVRSRAGVGHEIRFTTYSTVQLTEILQARAEHGLRDGAVDDRILERIALRAEGDARVAIRTLRVAAEAALDEYDSRWEMRDATISADDVPDATIVAKRTILEDLRDKFDDHQTTMLDVLIDDGGKLTTSEVFEEYSERMDDALSRRRMQDKFGKLIYYEAVRTEGTTSNKRYWANELLVEKVAAS